MFIEPWHAFFYSSWKLDVNRITDHLVFRRRHSLRFNFLTSVIGTSLPSFYSNDFITNLMPASWIYKQALLKSTAVYALCIDQ